jgi:hypothetical protein
LEVLPESQSRKLWTWKFSKWAEIEAVECAVDCVYNETKDESVDGGMLDGVEEADESHDFSYCLYSYDMRCLRPGVMKVKDAKEIWSERETERGKEMGSTMESEGLPGSSSRVG